MVSSGYSLQQPLMVAAASTDPALSRLHSRPFYRSPAFLLAVIVVPVVFIAVLAWLASHRGNAFASGAIVGPSFQPSSTASPSSSASPPVALSSSASPVTAPTSATSTAPIAPSSIPFPSASPSLTSSASLAPPPRVSLVSVANYSHQSSCFTQGLAFYQQSLYESCGLTGQSVVRQVNLSSGASILSTRLDARYFAEGLTVLNSSVYVLTWQNRVVLRYSLDLQLQQTLDIDTDGWGLTHNGSALIVSDGSSTLYYRDPLTMKLLRTVQVTKATSDGSAPQPVNDLNELEWVNGKVLANVWMTTDIVVIDDDGSVSEVLDGSAQLSAAGGDNWNRVMNGVAYKADAKQMFVTGKNWPLLFEVTGY